MRVIRDLSLCLSDIAPSRGFAFGQVVAVKGPIVSAVIPGCSIGDRCTILNRSGNPIEAQVVGFQRELVSLAPLDDPTGVAPGAKVKTTGQSPMISFSNEMLGTILDALGNPKQGPKSHSKTYPIPVHSAPPNPMSRSEINEQFVTGIRSIDTLLSIGYGQRLGLFAEAGVGKSTLLGMLAQAPEVDVTVVALIGERGREVKDFIEGSLNKKIRKKTIVVASTSDESPQRRVLAAETATAIAETYRSQGKRVLLLFDSLTRYARALRELSLAAGEIPVRHGFTPTVYRQLPKLLERTGTDKTGSITAIYTLLTPPLNESDPLAEEVQSILDGHIVLDSKLSSEGVHPAISVRQSISRLLPRFNSSNTLLFINKVRKLFSTLDRDRDIISFGGTPSRDLAVALAVEPDLNEFLKQSPLELSKLKDSSEQFLELLRKIEKVEIGLGTDPILSTETDPIQVEQATHQESGLPHPSQRVLDSLSANLSRV